MSTPPLHGIPIVEFVGIGRGPFAGMMLADHGAEVIRIDRGEHGGAAAKDPSLRSRTSVALDLKRPESVAAVRRIVAGADGIIEGFRPGVVERLGPGPEVLLANSRRLPRAIPVATPSRRRWREHGMTHE